ncbi:monooxygenase [Fusarium pseudocircinatum]|uniref:Monooxygenase n=1 Tax=Fusarium pseudocircinatum TaxID=56676 RepID=A0A8H5NV36_9HYPO|nr:monooxygenase [Fusarium pseudocircinatum]
MAATVTGAGALPVESQKHHYQDLGSGGLADVDKDPYAEFWAGEKKSNVEPGSEIKLLVIGAGIHGANFSLSFDHGFWPSERRPSKESGPIPKYIYPTGYKSCSYMERTAKKIGFKANFGIMVKQLSWNETESRWNATLARTLPGDMQSEPFVVSAQWICLLTGFLPNPQIPRLPSFASLRDTPESSVMHTTLWEWNISGGS